MQVNREDRIGPEDRMNATITLIDLVGWIALLLWGLHMVQSGIQRAFGPAFVVPSAWRWATASKRSSPAWG